MNIPLTIYEAGTGRFCGKAECPADMRDIQKNAVEGDFDGSTKYADITSHASLYDMVVLDRPTMPAVLNGLYLSDIPLDSIVPMKLEIKSNGKSDVYEVAGESTVELSFPFPGKYAIRLFGFPYIDKTWEVSV